MFVERHTFLISGVYNKIVATIRVITFILVCTRAIYKLPARQVYAFLVASCLFPLSFYN